MFWEDFDERVASLRPSAATSTTSDAMVEMRAYLAEPLLPLTSDTLAWWRRYSSVYESLSEVMKARLCIVATSVPSERIFSKTGQIISDRRNRLSPTKHSLYGTDRKNERLRPGRTRTRDSKDELIISLSGTDSIASMGLRD
ncbi:hypothetical protein DPEC_G00265970 [Dallia pectoralis]|uniref:Uncharacterized protein n=1 Tax=Dallia pectoralis TaxID=75939 RepID=A0ACC2FNM0_DALPE|nr:hypothetical protein DPEC_G00265970 [Dallia pectoralis]